MAKELIEYIREIRKVAGSQVGVHFGEKSPYHIREILRICEAAEQSVQRTGLTCTHLNVDQISGVCWECHQVVPFQPRR